MDVSNLRRAMLKTEPTRRAGGIHPSHAPNRGGRGRAALLIAAFRCCCFATSVLASANGKSGRRKAGPTQGGTKEHVGQLSRGRRA